MNSKDNKKIKVLMVNYEFPPIGGGGGTTTRFLAKYLAKLGVDVTVLTANPGKDDYLDHPEGFRIHYVGPKKNKLTTTHLPELARFALTIIYYSHDVIRTYNPDLIHSFFAVPSGSIGLYCKKAFNIPYITSALGADVPGFNIGDWRLDVYHSLTKFITKSIWNNSSFIVANSNSLKESCNKFSPTHNVKVITNGVDGEIFYPLRDKNYSENSINLLYVSRLTLQKKIGVLIKACAILNTRGTTNFKLTVVGDGHLKNEMFQKIKEYKIENKVNFSGWKNLEELPDIYRNADVFILPSVMEGMSSVALQAMACGLPIIASRVQGFEQVLEDNVNGLFAEYNNPDDFANAIEKLIKSKELREKMSKKSMEKSKDFLWGNIAKQYLELYEKAIDKRVINKEKNLVFSKG